MDTPQKTPSPPETGEHDQSRVLPPEAQRALAEAEARRKARDAAEDAKPGEVGGPKGLEPTRYGDWERKGIVSDF
jgi:hypothetical protein